MYSDLPVIVRDFLVYLETIRGKSEKTVSEYALDLRMFFRFMKLERAAAPDLPFEEIPVSDIDRDFIAGITLSDIYAFLSYLAKERGDAAATRARKVACLRSFFKYLTTKANLIDHNPTETLDSPHLRASLPVYLSLEESLQLLSVIDGPDRERDFAIITLFLNCGMRLSELVAINLTDIKENTVRVIGKGNKERTIYLNAACLSAIEDYLAVRPHDAVKAADKNALFLSNRRQRISTKTVQYLVKKYISLAGLEGKKYSTHKLRHTAATLMFRNGGVDVRTLQEILGHAQLTTTQIYTHVSDEQMRRASEKNPLASVTKKRLSHSAKRSDDTESHQK
ncbi:tyrosine recombinase XerC [Feifania hominis]|uniref:Tyrosine recombinase XerC n=1 Tax=Feifania hominis TaxID=2763660 RepID=A0A926DD26_9FIRM|nr:tyrosine recombinase XerC [Feifania hominis]MBC8535584.1 tyrosine recombinase XerC [Feifania hominis]